MFARASSFSPDCYISVTLPGVYPPPSTSTKTLLVGEMTNKKREMDLMPQIKRIVRDAIKDGLIKSERLQDFDHKVKNLKGAELEAYLQRLWDEL